MKILKDWPPNIKEIKVRFPDMGNQVLFAYGNVIYSPSTYDIPDYLIAHEEIHEKQQGVMGVEEWWNKYLTDDKFMLEQEVEAYHAQYEFYCERESNLNLRYKMLASCAKALSGPTYGYSIGRAHALFRIKIWKVICLS